MTTDVEAIARGEQPVWEQTFKHPDHGELTFRIARKLTSRDWLQAAAVQEQFAPGVTIGFGVMLAEACAGLVSFAELPVLSEKRTQDPDNPAHDTIEKTFYDPLADEHTEFPIIVWGAFQLWRNQLLSPETVEKVKNSSDATSQPEIVASSPATTA